MERLQRVSIPFDAIKRRGRELHRPGGLGVSIPFDAIKSDRTLLG